MYFVMSGTICKLDIVLVCISESMPDIKYVQHANTDAGVNID